MYSHWFRMELGLVGEIVRFGNFNQFFHAVLDKMASCVLISLEKKLGLVRERVRFEILIICS